MKCSGFLNKRIAKELKPVNKKKWKQKKLKN